MATRSRVKRRWPPSARSAIGTRSRRSSPRATTNPRCGDARCWRSRRSTDPRSTPPSTPRSTIATGRSARPPRTSVRTDSPPSGVVTHRVEEQLLVSADVLGPLVARPVPPVEAAGRVGVPVGGDDRRGARLAGPAHVLGPRGAVPVAVVVPAARIGVPARTVHRLGGRERAGGRTGGRRLLAL